MDTHPEPSPPPPRAAAAPRLAAVVVEPFPLWLAERRDPTLARTPLAACEGERILHANPAARRWGIDRGMRLTGARLRAPGLQLAPCDEPDLAQGWRELASELRGWTPWLDASRRGRAFVRVEEAEAAAIAERLGARVGVADDLETAELAALAARPGQARVVAAGAERAFLDRLPLRFLRGVGMGEGELTRLGWLGLATAGDLARWTATQVRAYLTEAGEALLPYLHGPRRRRLAPWTSPMVLRRTLAFERPLFEPGDLEPALDHLARSLALDLRGRAARHVTVATEGGGGARRASRLAKRPLRGSGQIRQQALFALRDTGAAAAGIDGLTIELAAPERLAEAAGLWDARRQREGAIDTVLERYPHALVRVGWGDPHAPAADLAWRWLPLEEATVRSAPAPRSARRRATPHELDAPLGAVAPAALRWWATERCCAPTRPSPSAPAPPAPPPWCAAPPSSATPRWRSPTRSTSPAAPSSSRPPTGTASRR
jgi:protein ImuB